MLNYLISNINKRIATTTYKFDKAFFFQDINLDLISKINRKWKVDNHPNLMRQYISLYNYILFLIETLSQYLISYNGANELQKYKILSRRLITK